MIATALERSAAFGAGPCGTDFRRELKDCFERRQKELGISDSQLVRSFSVKARLGALLALRRFHRDGQIDERMRASLQRRLGISDGEFSAAFGRFFYEAYADRRCFFSNLGLFARNASLILKTPAYASVTFYGASAPDARGEDEPLTVGELLWRYCRGWWIFGEGAQRAFVCRISNEAGSGAIVAEAADCNGGVSRFRMDLERAEAALPLMRERRFPAGETSWTVRSLARRLSGRGLWEF
jgi:hypothetical protein